MRYPTWEQFLGKNSNNTQDAFEALCRLLFKTRFGIGDSLQYFYNNAGNETAPIVDGDDVVGFQSKFFTGATIDDSQAAQIKHSIEIAHSHYPNQNKIIVYTNLVFGNPPAGKTETERQKSAEETARKNSLEIEWMFGDNILDAVSKNPLAYSLFFDMETNLSHLANSVLKLNKLNFDNIGTTITCKGKEIQIDRSKEVAELKELLVQGKNVMIVGESGSGKSAIVKSHWLESLCQEDVAYYFTRGNQFETRAVNDIFTLDEEYTFVGFRDFYQGFGTKIFVIDSAEWLTEIENMTILQLVVDGLGENGWQFIFTCKSNAGDELRSLFKDLALTVDEINVEPVSEDTLQTISNQYSIQLPDSAKLFQQLQIPFYLARYCELDTSNVSTPEVFKETVWRQKVWGNIKGGVQQKREDCLLSIVRDQQTKRTYYVTPAGIDHDIAYALVKEDVLIHHPHKGYAAKHDIYVDWALDYILDNDIESEVSVQAIISTEPQSITYLNAFTRWFSCIIDLPDARVSTIVEAYMHGRMHKKWEYNILSCIGKSELYATSFFKQYNDELKTNNYHLFDKFVDVLCLSCRRIKQYFEYKDERIPIYEPAGKGWDEAIIFISVNQADYYMDHLGSVQKLLDGYKRAGKNGVALQKAAELTLPIFNTMAEARKQQESFWADNLKPWCDLVCSYAYGIRKELRVIFHEVLKNKWTSHRDPYAELIEYILKDENHLGKSMLYLACLDEVIDLMDLFWRESSRDANHKHNNFWNIKQEYLFGLNERYGMDMAYFPASPFQTPIKAMLEAEQMLTPKGTKTLDFIIRFIDECISDYEKRSTQGKPYRIPVQLPNGETHEVITSQALWNIYRGTASALVPHVIESVHMALEKYLFYLAGDKNEKPEWDMIKELLWRILFKSRSASLYSIVASMAVAYPNELYDILLFLCQDVRFLSADLHRFSMEITANHRSITFHRHEAWWKERDQSNNLPHRQQHLETVLLYYQFVYDNSDSELAKTRLERTYQVVDKLKLQAINLEKEDATYGMIIARLDYRSQNKQEVTLKNGVVAIQLTPNLTPEQKAMRDDAERVANRMGAMGLRVWADKKFRGEEESLKGSPYVNNPKLALDTVRTIEKQLERGEWDPILMQGDGFVPYMVSAVLLIYYQNNLTEEDNKECYERVMQALKAPEAMASNSLSEYNICMAAIPAMMDFCPEKSTDFVPIIFSLIKEPYEYINERICDIISRVIVTGQLWEKHPEVLREVLDAFKAELSNKDFDTMDEVQADALLCLLTYNPPSDLRYLGKICIDKLSEKWHVIDRYSYDETKHRVAENISKYILFAPQQEISKLIDPFISYLDMDSTSEPLITDFLINAVQYEKYENFWAVWKMLYHTVIQNVGRYQNSTLHEYLLNPLFFRRDYDDWFKLKEKDLEFFFRIGNDIGGHPAVMAAFSRVFGTIGKQYTEKAIKLFYQIITLHNPRMKDTREMVIYYMDRIIKKVMTENSREIQTDIEFKDQFVKVLEYMRDNGSSEANKMINLM